MRPVPIRKTICIILSIICLLSGCSQQMRPSADTGTPHLSAGQDQTEAPSSSQESTAAAETAEIPETFAERYARGFLSGPEQELYDCMVAAVAAGEPSVMVQGLSEDAVIHTGEAVWIDWPEFFWLAGGNRLNTRTLNGVVTDITYYFEYSMTGEELEAAKEEVEASAGRFLAGIADGWSDYEKVKTVYDRVALETDYVGEEQDQSLYHVITQGEGVCAGYARTVQYLLNRLGIFCTFVSGTAKGENHAWNLVQMDGDYYYLDPTWGDPVFSGETQAGEDYIDYAYFGVTTEELLRTHQPDDALALPQCTAVECNYFVKNRLMFSGYDAEGLQRVFSESASEGRTDLVVRFTDAAVRAEAVSRLVEEQQVYELLEKAALENQKLVTDRIRYSDQGELNTVHFRLMYE